MTDTEINVTGNIHIANDHTAKPNFFQFPPHLYMSAPNAKEWVALKRETIRPWTVFLTTSNFKPPASLPRLTKRIVRNIEYFQSNYLCVFTGLILYCLLTSPLLLIAIGISVGIGYQLSKRQAENKFTILGKEITLAQQYGCVAVFSIPLFLWAGAGAAVFWVLGASILIIRTRATEMYQYFFHTFSLSLLGFLWVLQAVVIELLFSFCFYYLGASFFIIALHATFYHIDAVVKSDDSFALLENV